LLEAQLISYQKGDKSYAFLSYDRIRNYDDLNSLFFQVLAKKQDERDAKNQKLFEKVPYLNSSLFEPTELEHEGLFIGYLKNDLLIPIHNKTVLKDTQGKTVSGQLGTLEYLFRFLDAYDFSGEGSEEIQEDNKALINASVLGLIFEKINGYKDGSFFTPGFITMYMCRETIRRAVVQKFNEAKEWNCETLYDIYNKDIDRKEANAIINSLHICDPAVGSGHFLVSALNEIISIKSDLNILLDRDGKRLKEYKVEVVNDELMISDEDGFYEYRPGNKESQRVQEALFHEKQTIIENCLFGVDINPNSVKICRLRLWIELLKNAYYKNATELETLPNIDINIKCGNSLVSRFPIDADLKQALKKSKWTIDSYKIAVDTYRNAENREQKREMLKLISEIKSDFKSEISKNDSKVKKLTKLKDDLYYTANPGQLFEQTPKEKTARSKKISEISKDIEKLEAEIEEIKANKIYENAFEWRFEFPEVLNDDGAFVGFDVVIGNPPYISHDKIEITSFLKSNSKIFEAFADLYCYFFELGINIVNSNGLCSLITSNSFLKAEYGKPLRLYLNESGQHSHLINLNDTQIFEDAIVNTSIAIFQKNIFSINSIIINTQYHFETDFPLFISENSFIYTYEDFKTNSWTLVKPEFLTIGRRMSLNSQSLEDLGTKIRLGLATGSNDVFVIDSDKKNTLIVEDPKGIEIIKPVLRGRDITRYHYNQEKYIILSKNGINIEEHYPAIFNYFNSFDSNFKNRGAQGTHWTNLRASSFYEDFKLPKIIWIELSDKNKFCVCLEEIYLLNSAYFLIPPEGIDIYFLTGLLNSSAIKFFLSLIANTSGVGTLRWINIYVKDFPIKRDIIIEDMIAELSKQIHYFKNQDLNADTSLPESQIDQLVYRLYGLSEEEIAIVEATILSK